MFCNKNIEISVWLYYIVFRSFVTIALKKKKFINYILTLKINTVLTPKYRSISKTHIFQ